MKREIVFALLLVLTGVFVSAVPNFEVSGVLMKVSLRDGDSVTKTIGVSAKSDGQFTLSVNSIDGVSLSSESFFLPKGERKEIDVLFNSSAVEPGIYVGHIEVLGPDGTTLMPLVLEIETTDVFFDANLDIPPIYTEIEQGEKLVSQIKIFDLTSGGGTQNGLGSVSIELDYYVFNLEGSVISSESESIVVEGRTQITKVMTFPETAEPGTYVASVVVKYLSSVGIASQSFEIVEAGKNDSSFFDFSDYNLIIIIGIFVIFLLGIVALFIYLLHDRDRIFVELRKYNSQEVRRVAGLMKEQQRLLKGRRDSSEVRMEADKKIKKLKKVQRSRFSEIKKLKSKGSVSEMKRKINEWKNKGYDTSPLEYKIKGLTSGEMKSLVKKWKKKYSKPKKPKD